MNRYELDDMYAEKIINRYKNFPKTTKAVFVIGVKNDNTSYLLDYDDCFSVEDESLKYAISVKASIPSIKAMTNTKAIIVVLARRISNYFVVLKTRTIQK